MNHFPKGAVKVHRQSEYKGSLYGGDLHWPTGLEVEKPGLIRSSKSWCALGNTINPTGEDCFSAVLSLCSALDPNSFQ